jgi:hypothetical protein
MEALVRAAPRDATPVVVLDGNINGARGGWVDEVASLATHADRSRQVRMTSDGRTVDIAVTLGDVGRKVCNAAARRLIDRYDFGQSRQDVANLKVRLERANARTKFVGLDYPLPAPGMVARAQLDKVTVPLVARRKLGLNLTTGSATFRLTIANVLPPSCTSAMGRVTGRLNDALHRGLKTVNGRSVRDTPANVRFVSARRVSADPARPTEGNRFFQDLLYQDAVTRWGRRVLDAMEKVERYREFARWARLTIEKRTFIIEVTRDPNLPRQLESMDSIAATLREGYAAVSRDNPVLSSIPAGYPHPSAEATRILGDDIGAAALALLGR